MVNRIIVYTVENAIDKSSLMYYCTILCMFGLIKGKRWEIGFKILSFIDPLSRWTVWFDPTGSERRGLQSLLDIGLRAASLLCCASFAFHWAEISCWSPLRLVNPSAESALSLRGGQ